MYASYDYLICHTLPDSFIYFVLGPWVSASQSSPLYSAHSFPYNTAFFRDRVLLCTPGWPQIHDPAVFLALGLRVWATSEGFKLLYSCWPTLRVYLKRMCRSENSLWKCWSRKSPTLLILSLCTHVIRVELKRIASDVEKPFIRKSLCMLEERSLGKLTADFSTRLRALLSLLCKHGTWVQISSTQAKPVWLRACKPSVEGLETG